MNATSRALPGPHATTSTIHRRAVVLRAEVLENARLAVEQDPMRIAAESEERRYWRHLWVAVVVSPTLEVAEALLRDESVPRARLDAGQVTRFGLR